MKTKGKYGHLIMMEGGFYRLCASRQQQITKEKQIQRYALLLKVDAATEKKA